MYYFLVKNVKSKAHHTLGAKTMNNKATENRR